MSNSKIAYTSGLPATLFGKSELLSLQRIDIDFARRSIEVETVYTQTHEARSVPKTDLTGNMEGMTKGELRLPAVAGL